MKVKEGGRMDKATWCGGLLGTLKVPGVCIRWDKNHKGVLDAHLSTNVSGSLQLSGTCISKDVRYVVLLWVI
jgi:hypothetical protein